MYLLGFDIGSSSVKVSLIEGETGRCVGSSWHPSDEMAIHADRPGWAEQHPELWWHNLKLALADVLHVSGVKSEAIRSIGISYQMHGLVLVDKNYEVLRPSIIWCDSRAATIGEKAFLSLGPERCLGRLLNAPGNFTASKMRWVKEHEPQVYDRVFKMMLPGDYIAMKLTGEIRTTMSGLSEGILWDFKEHALSRMLLDYYGISPELIPEVVPTFSVQGQLRPEVAKELGLSPKTTVSYRAGDQPNNAFSLQVMHPGEVAATAGTSGVVYGVSDEIRYDPQSRVNTFAHVNHSAETRRLGVLLCINGTGILNAWLRRMAGEAMSYDQMNRLASAAPVGSNGLVVLPFGNGAERMLNHRDVGSGFFGINYNIHQKGDLFRAAQEGIVFSFNYGMEVMKNAGIQAKVIRAGKANMFLSPVFRDTLAGITQATIELYNTDGSIGAARGAGIGCGYYSTEKESFMNLIKLETIEPVQPEKDKYLIAYHRWKKELENALAKPD